MSRMGPVGACRRFFAQQDPRSKTLVLGFSGGADSYALLDSCDRLRQEYGFGLVVAHLDHGWRASSAQEAEQLAEQISQRGLVWKTQRVDMGSGPNLEERAREARLAFFTEVLSEHQATAVLLAHQQDDLVETTLKRVLEGAALDKLHGLRPVHRVGALWLWRPLLGVSRAQIDRYVARRRLPVVQDASNQDPRFLRSRMRYQMIPQIERLLGKGIRRPLAQLAQRSQELEQQRQASGIPKDSEAIPTIRGFHSPIPDKPHYSAGPLQKCDGAPPVSWVLSEGVPSHLPGASTGRAVDD